jgi:PilZ domain
MTSVAVSKRTHRSNAAATAERPSDNRAFVRLSFRSAAFKVRMVGGECEIRLKDLSRGGASGLICEPVDVGDHLVVEFDRRHQVDAEVCWVRRLLVGIRFTNELTPQFVERLHELYRAAR